jgi:hypothetical protein
MQNWPQTAGGDEGGEAHSISAEVQSLVGAMARPVEEIDRVPFLG